VNQRAEATPRLRVMPVLVGLNLVGFAIETVETIRQKRRSCRAPHERRLQQALLPVFSTKEGGSGSGLPLRKEIVEGHGGTFGFAVREGGGTSVTLALPGHAAPGSLAHAWRLTLTRG
jgi:sensor histidine kinase regulating citrate/malate metabolism